MSEITPERDFPLIPSNLRKLEIEKLQSQIAEAQNRLAEMETALGIEKRKVDAIRAKLFTKLRKHYERRDQLRLVVLYRKKFIHTFLHSGEENAERVREQFQQADADNKREYESTAAALAKKRELSAAEEQELRVLWKKLVKLFHPDRVHDDPAKCETYQKLTQAINHAKDAGDLDTLREIASDPDSFIRKQGWQSVDLLEEENIEALKRLLEMLHTKIAKVIEDTKEIKESPDCELHRLYQHDPDILNALSEQHREQIEAECVQLTAEAEELREQIEALTGETALG